MPFTPVMRAPDEEQSVVGPFFESNRPVCGSLGVVAFGPPLSGSPIPRSHAAVTIRLPAGDGVHSAAVPTNVNGTACTPLSSSATAEPGNSPTSAATVTSTNTRLMDRLPLCVARNAMRVVWPEHLPMLPTTEGLVLLPRSSGQGLPQSRLRLP